MRVPFLVATSVALMAGLVSVSINSVRAQGQSPSGQAAAPNQRPGTMVAVVDVKHIFDNHTRFKQAMDEIKKNHEAFETQIRETETVLRKKIEELKALGPGSDQFKQLEEQIAQTRTAVQLDINRKQKERVEAEALVYYRAYDEIKVEITKCADRYGIDLVLQHSTLQIDPSKPETVIRGLNQQVVFQRSLSITDHILQELNRQSPPQNASPLPSTANRGAAPRSTPAAPQSKLR